MARHWKPQDLRLGMQRRITRRDVLHGLAWAGAAGLAPGALAQAAAGATADAPADYPPAWTGMRGSAPGSFEVAHALRDGAAFDAAQDLDEDYDLIVVGGGISGLAAAQFYRERRGAGARVLILDNHDDFGGHARRNEFRLKGRLHLLHGGSAEIGSPRPYSAVADGLLRRLGLDVAALRRAYPHPEFSDESAAGYGVFFDRETFGADKLVAGRQGKSWLQFLDAAPLTAAARADLQRLDAGTEDYLAGLEMAARKELLARISYRDFLRDHAKVDPQVLQVYAGLTKGEWGVGIDAVSALDFWGFAGKRAPGLAGLKLAPGATAQMSYTAAGYAQTGGSYYFHFPDGNATIARLLVRALIPHSVAARTVQDLITARFDYRRLDEAAAPVRLRLRSTVVHAANALDAQGGVRVTYVPADGRARRVRGRACVLACYNTIIPYLCPELPQSQKDALHTLIKTPLVYASVALRSARPLERLGVRYVYAPQSYFTTVVRNPALPMGSYRPPRGPDDPTLVFLERDPCRPGLPEKEQNRAGRAELLATPFETFERNIRDQLGRILGPGGLDPARDIVAITVNRWPHGYAGEYNALFEPLLPEAQQAHVIGRARCGNIAIANSDAGHAAFADIAMDQADRAIGELLAGTA